MEPVKSMFDTLCTLPLPSDLFTQAIHPSEPLVAVGLASGHVQSFRLPSAPEDDDSDSAASHGVGQIETAWQTRRHKGSCRSLVYGIDGNDLFSAGTDGLVKCADTETGKVTAKIAVPDDPNTGDEDLPTLLHVLSPQTLLLASDSSALYLYDIRIDHKLSRKPQQTHHPHEDYISSLTPLAPTEASTSGFSKQWVSTGGTTLAVTDIRRGVLVRSEDQEEELLSSVYVGGFRKKGTSTGQKVLVGGAGGVITLWERGQWDDQDERIILDRGVDKQGGESIDTLTLLPDGVGPPGKIVAAGMGNGSIRFINCGPNRVVGELGHDEAEGVVAVGFDVGGRMISGGGPILKVWCEPVGAVEADEDKEEPSNKRKVEDSSEDEDESEDEESSEDERVSKKKRGKKGKRQPGNQMGSGGKWMDFKGLD